MSTPIHKTCYRCERPVAELVQPADALGGLHGVCADCHLTLGAREVARRWHARHPEAGTPGMSNDQCPMTNGAEAPEVLPQKGAEDAKNGTEIPRGMVAPHCTRCGCGAVEAAGLWWCPNEACAGYYQGVNTISGAGAPVSTNEQSEDAPASGK